MPDTVTPETRSRIMAAIRGTDTRPELRLRRALHRLGFRYRLHDRRLPGTPDLVLPRRRAVVLVHGCFWHRHPGCRSASTPATREAFWTDKFAATVARDARTLAALRAAGWRVAVVWECALKGDAAAATVDAVAAWLRSETDGATLELPAPGAAPPASRAGSAATPGRRPARR